MLDVVLYNWMRNARMFRKKEILEFANYDWKKDLERCLMLSRFCRNSVQENFYIKLWEQKDKY